MAFFLPISVALLALAVFVVFLDGRESDLWWAPFSPVLGPLGIMAFGALAVLVAFRSLQVAGVIGVAYVRAFSDGSALLGSWWRVRRGQGLVVHRATKVRVKAVETMPKMFGWRSDTGIPVYMAWTVAAKGRKFSWLTPFEVAPGAAQRIHADLSGLPEPTFDSLETSQAAQAA